MRVYVLLLSLCFLSCRSVAWELQQFTTCERVSIKLNAYSMCLPKDYFFDRVNDDRITLISQEREEIIVFHNSSYAQYKNKSIDDDMIFKKSMSKYGREIYVHQSNEHLGVDDYVYTWSVSLEGESFFLVISGFSEKNIDKLFREIITSAKEK